MGPLVLVLVLSVAVSGMLQFRYNKEKHAALGTCLLKIAKEQLKTKKLVFFLEDSESSNFESLVKINWERVIISSNNVSTVSGIFVFLPDSNASLSFEKIFKVKHLDHNSVYIICTDSINYIYLFFDTAWEFKIIDAIALFPSSRTNRISIYTYFPFGTLGCSVTDPVRINIYDGPTNTFQFREKVFSQREKLYNLYNCPVRVTVKEKSAKTLTNRYSQGDIDTVTRLFHLLQVRMNFTPTVVLVDNEANTYAAAYYNFTSAAVLDIVKGNSDIAVGRFIQLIDYHEDTLAPVQTSMDCFTWAVPMKAGSKPSVWTTSLYEFDFITWLLFIFCFVLCSLFCHFISKKLSKYNNPTLGLFGMLLNVSVNMKNSSNTMRVFIAHWLLFCLVMVAAYSASLGSLVTVPPDSLDIKTTSELLDKDLILVGDPKMYHILSASSSTSNDIKRVLEKFMILRPNEFDHIINDIYTNRDRAVFYTKSMLIQEENRVRSELKLSDMVHVVPDCLIGSYTSPLILRKGSMLTKPVKEMVNRLLESGLINYWAELEEEAFRPKGSNNEALAFTVSQLRGALIVIISGYLLSTVAFLYEVYSAKVKLKSSLEKKISPKKKVNTQKSLKNAAVFNQVNE